MTYVLAAIYFPLDAVFCGHGQADLKLDHQSFGAAEIAGLDQAAALSLPRIVFGARDHPLSRIATLIELLKLVLVERLFSSVSSAIS